VWNKQQRENYGQQQTNLLCTPSASPSKPQVLLLNILINGEPEPTGPGFMKGKQGCERVSSFRSVTPVIVPPVLVAAIVVAPEQAKYFE